MPKYYDEIMEPRKRSSLPVVILALLLFVLITGGIIYVVSTNPFANNTESSNDQVISETNKSQEVEEYISAAVKISDKCTVSFTTLGNLMETPLLGDFEWTKQVEKELNIIVDLANQVNALKAPESMQDIHYYFNLGMQYFKSSCIKLANGINNLDYTLIDSAKEDMESGTEYILKATSLIYQYNK